MLRCKSILLPLAMLVCLGSFQSGLAIDFFFEPDTAFGEAGDTILVSGRIGSSDSMRGFTVYIAYDTNLIDLAEPVVPGSLIAGRQGLNFGFFDHDYLPDLLEVYGTIMNPSVDFWAGPGELFQLRFELRMCADAPMTAPYSPFFIDAEGGFPPVTFHPGLTAICGRVPLSTDSLTIEVVPPDSVLLRWPSVRQDTLGRPLFEPAEYAIFRQQMLPVPMPQVRIATVSDTFLADSIGTGTEYLYYVITQTDE
jgi:hypothetical protein